MSLDYQSYKYQYICEGIKALQNRMNRLDELTPIEQTAGVVIFMVHQCVGTYNMSVSIQHKIGIYTADFLIRYYGEDDWDNPTKKIVVECDGHDFHEKTKEQAAKDKKRDRFMQKEGYIVLRYTGSEIYNEPTKIFNDLLEIICPNKEKKLFPKTEEKQG